MQNIQTHSYEYKVPPYCTEVQILVQYSTEIPGHVSGYGSFGLPLDTPCDEPGCTFLSLAHPTHLHALRKTSKMDSLAMQVDEDAGLAQEAEPSSASVEPALGGKPAIQALVESLGTPSFDATQGPDPATLVPGDPVLQSKRSVAEGPPLPMSVSSVVSPNERIPAATPFLGAVAPGKNDVVNRRH